MDVNKREIKEKNEWMDEWVDSSKWKYRKRMNEWVDSSKWNYRKDG